jgi:HEAT repeat protein
LLVAVTLLGASEELDTYTRLYGVASSGADRLGIIQQVAESNIPDSAEFYAMALERLLASHPTMSGATELGFADEIARRLAELLGDAKHLPAAGNLWRVANTFSNPLVRGDAITALGKMEAVALLPQIVKVLTDLNETPTVDRLAGEQVAFSAILALESYKDASGYLPVFFAAADSAWYSERVKNRARVAFPRILEDPSEPLTQVIQSPAYPYAIKYMALQAIENSGIPEDKKAAFALAAFGEAWRASTNDRQQRMILVNIRKRSIDMIRRYKTGDAAVYPLLERSYKEGVDEEEKLGTISALSALASEDSAKLLGAFLTEINTKLRDNSLTPGDERLIRAIIPAIGSTGRPEAAPPLRTVLTLDWTNRVKILAREALQKLQ